MTRCELLKKIKAGIKKFSNQIIEGDFYDSELANIEFERCRLNGDFSGANFTNTIIYRCNLMDCKFRYVDLSQTLLEENLLDSTDFSFANFNTSRFINNTLYGIPINNDNRDLLKTQSSIGMYISDVKHGWFKLQIFNENKSMKLETSNIMGHDGPRELLRAIEDLTSKKINERWIAWYGEPTTDIWKLCNEGSHIGIQIYHSIKYFYELRHEELYLKEQVGELCFDSLVDRLSFIRECLISFRRVRDRIGIKEYEEAWFPYPKAEIKELTRLCGNRT